MQLEFLFQPRNSSSCWSPTKLFTSVTNMFLWPHWRQEGGFAFPRGLLFTWNASLQRYNVECEPRRYRDYALIKTLLTHSKCSFNWQLLSHLVNVFSRNENPVVSIWCRTISRSIRGFTRPPCRSCWTRPDLKCIKH